MAKTTTAKDLVNSKVVQKYIANIDKDAQAAMDTVNANLKYSGLKYYSNKLVSDYKADESRLDKAWGNFNLAWNKVVFGKAKDSKELIKTYSKYVLALEILEQQNVKHSALVGANLAMIAAAFMKFAIAFFQEINKRCAQLEKDLAQLKALAEKAKREIKEAQVQVALNLIITGASMCLGPVGWTARIGVAVGGIAVHTIIDASLGPSSGSALGTINTASGETLGVAKKLSPGAQKLMGGVSAVITLKMDFDEVGQAEKILKEIQALSGRTLREYVFLMKLADKDGKKVAKLNQGLQAAGKMVRSNAGKFSSSKKKREELIKEFKSWK